jgi:hypothetical protein
MSMDQLQHFTGSGTVYRANGSALRGERRYSITLIPHDALGRPLAIGSWVELYGDEPLQLENEELRVQLSDGRWFAFRITDVSEMPPHQHIFRAQDWPSHPQDQPQPEQPHHEQPQEHLA